MTEGCTKGINNPKKVEDYVVFLDMKGVLVAVESVYCRLLGKGSLWNIFVCCSY